MIDTIKLFIEDFTVKPEAEITIQPSSYILGSGELTSNYPLIESEGVSVGGAKAYLNTERFNLTIRDKNKAFLQCSLPKVFAGDNYQPLDKKEAEQAINSVGKELWESGFHTEINKSSISRLDSFRNVLTEEPYMQYADLFRVLRGKRKQKRDYGSTFLWHNTQEELTVYDKIAEMRIKKVDIRNYPINTMRFEHRLLNKRKASKVLGFSAAGEIADNWQVIKDKTRQAWERDIFSFTVDDIEVLASSEVEDLYRYFKNKRGLYLDNFFKYYGALQLSKMISPETFGLVIERVESDKSYDARRMKVKRAVRRLEEMSRTLTLALPGRVGKRLSDYYIELKNKVLID